MEYIKITYSKIWKGVWILRLLFEWFNCKDLNLNYVRWSTALLHTHLLYQYVIRGFCFLWFGNVITFKTLNNCKQTSYHCEIGEFLWLYQEKKYSFCPSKISIFFFQPNINFKMVAWETWNGLVFIFIF